MPKVRDLLCRVHVEVAQGKRKCHRNQRHSVLQGEAHLAVYDGETAARRNYCGDCARPILDLARERLDTLEAELYS